MPYILSYTKPGVGCYSDANYPGHVAYNCDWEHAMHLAVSKDGEHFTLCATIPASFSQNAPFPRAGFRELQRRCCIHGFSVWQTVPSAFRRAPQPERSRSSHSWIHDALYLKGSCPL